MTGPWPERFFGSEQRRTRPRSKSKRGPCSDRCAINTPIPRDTSAGLLASVLSLLANFFVGDWGRQCHRVYRTGGPMKTPNGHGKARTPPSRQVAPPVVQGSHNYDPTPHVFLHPIIKPLFWMLQPTLISLPAAAPAPRCRTSRPVFSSVIYPFTFHSPLGHPVAFNKRGTAQGEFFNLNTNDAPFNELPRGWQLSISLRVQQ